MQEDLMSILLKAPIFSSCNKEILRCFLEGNRYRLRRKSADLPISHMGDECSDVMILIEGTVYTNMTNDADKEVVIETIKGPLILAPAFVYGEDTRLPVNIIAKTECVTLYIDKAAFLDLLNKDKNMMTAFIRILSDRCCRLSRRVHEDNLRSLKERVVEYLRINGSIDNIQWVSRIFGVARPSLSRVLSELADDGLIERTSGSIVLKKV